MQSEFLRFITRGLLAALLVLWVLAIAGPVVAQPIDTLAGDVTLAEDLIGTVALAEEPAGTVEKLLTVWLPRLVMACAGLAAFFPSTNKVMRIVDVFALNWNKARSDPNAQKWGKG